MELELGAAQEGEPVEPAVGLVVPDAHDQAFPDEPVEGRLEALGDEPEVPLLRDGHVRFVPAVARAEVV